MALVIAVLWFLFYIGLVALAVHLLFWGLAYLGVPIPPIVPKIVWFLVAILAIIMLFRIIWQVLTSMGAPRLSYLQPLVGVLT